MIVNFYGISDIGRVKQLNQDALYYNVTPDGSAGVFAVADGVGGLKFGEVASSKAAQYIEEWWKNFLICGLGGDSRKTTDNLSELVFGINNEVCFFNEQNQTQSATTLSLLVIYGGLYYFAHVGDSRIYAYSASERKVYQITNDHSKDIIKERNGRQYVQSALTDGLGHKKSIKCDICYGALNNAVNGFMVCSDGVYKRQSDIRIAEIISASGDAKAVCENLIFGAKQAGESDNITAAYVNIIL